MQEIRTKSLWAVLLCIMAPATLNPAFSQTVFPTTAVLDTTLMELPYIREDENLVIHQGYISSFNKDLHIPDWVAYELTVEELEEVTGRQGSFKQDKSIPLQQASNADYLKTGYDKGHMAPAADMKWSEETMYESFFFTNICPQKPRLNQRYWLGLEKMTRNSVEKYGKVWVISGAIPASDSLQTIGKNIICVPAKFYKALLSYDGTSYFSIAFLMDNTNDPQPVYERAMTVDTLEEILSVDLFKNLGADAEIAESYYTLSSWVFEKEDQAPEDFPIYPPLQFDDSYILFD